MRETEQEARLKSIAAAMAEVRKNVADAVSPKPHESMTTIMQKVLR